VTEHVKALTSCWTSSWAHFYAILMTFSSGTGFPRVFPSAASTWATSSTLMHLQLVPLTWKCIHHEWLTEWTNEWGMSWEGVSNDEGRGVGLWTRRCLLFLLQSRFPNWWKWCLWQGFYTLLLRIFMKYIILFMRWK